MAREATAIPAAVLSLVDPRLRTYALSDNAHVLYAISRLRKLSYTFLRLLVTVAGMPSGYF